MHLIWRHRGGNAGSLRGLWRPSALSFFFRTFFPSCHPLCLVDPISTKSTLVKILTKAHLVTDLFLVSSSYFAVSKMFGSKKDKKKKDKTAANTAGLATKNLPTDQSGECVCLVEVFLLIILVLQTHTLRLPRFAPKFAPLLECLKKCRLPQLTMKWRNGIALEFTQILRREGIRLLSLLSSECYLEPRMAFCVRWRRFAGASRMAADAKSSEMEVTKPARF